MQVVLSERNFILNKAAVFWIKSFLNKISIDQTQGGAGLGRGMNF